jgi:hypothetical protein
MTGNIWWSKAAHLMATEAGKEKERRVQGPNIPFRGMLPYSRKISN